MSSGAVSEQPGELEIERREHRRHLAKLRVQMLSSDTVPINVRTVGLSLGGMHVECDRQYAQLMALPTDEEGQTPLREFTARIVVLSDDLEPKTLTISTDVVDVTAVDDDVYRVGLRFSGYYGKSKQILQEFLDSLE